MKQKFYVPRANYIVFELVKVKVDNYLTQDQEFEAELVDTIYLAVMPSQIRYGLTARDSMVQTQKDIYLTRFDFAPERCNIQGSFGDMPRQIAGTLMDGWSRLRQFQEQIVRLSKEVEYTYYTHNRQGEESKRVQNGAFIHTVNYYDFAFQKFGQININTWNISGNANLNTNFINYNCDFTIIGELMKTDKKDYLLDFLNNVYGEEGILNEAISEVNDFLGSAGVSDALSQVGASLGALSIAGDLVNGALGGLSGFQQAGTNVYKSIL